jgi:alpha-glucosidase
MITNTELEYKGNLFPTAYKSHTKKSNVVEFESQNGVLMQVHVLRDDLLRFRCAPEGFFAKDFSYAIDQKQEHGYNTLDLSENDSDIIITTEKIICKVSKADLRVGLYDLEGNVILEDELGFHWEESFEYGGNFVKMSKSSRDGENFYGLGDKPTNFNLKGKRTSNWNTDQYAYGKDKEELYKDVPFYVGLHDKMAYGIFFDNTFKTHFDFCHERRNVMSFWADGGEMNYYFFYGPEMSKVVKAYSDLTGKPELPPMWAMGYHQCKWSYYPESRVREITSKFRELSFPCDAIYLDIDYMDGFRCFTWNKEYFPNPKQMIDDFNEQGFKTVAIIDPGIKIDRDNEVFQEALEKDYFCKRADGSYMKGKVWPGECYFPDFTNPEVREWWASLYKGLIEEDGVHGVWNDMNEPAVMEVPGKTFPNDVRHSYDGNYCSHRKAHNVYGMQMARATYHGVKRHAAPKRPFVITRATYSGGQRYTSSWTGDNVATWEHLWLANIQVQRMSLSGMGFVGTDIGGFAEQPSGELFTRWVQLGVFHPFTRVHSSGHHGDQEPWSFDQEVLEITKKFVELRYQLLPYIYTMYYKYTTQGDPMIKPLVYFDQEDHHTHYRSDEFIFGDQILVCPVQEPNAQGRRMYMPRGNWYNMWTQEFVEGGKELWVNAPLDSMPVFVKEGSVIPKYPVQQYVDEQKIETLELDVYYKKGRERSSIYEDAHDGYDYKRGKYILKKIKFYGKEKEVLIDQFRDGRYETTYNKVQLNLIGLPFELKNVTVDTEEVSLSDLNYNKEKQSIEVDANFHSIIIK